MNLFENLKKYTTTMRTSTSNLQLSKGKEPDGIFFIESEYGIENNLVYNSPAIPNDLFLDKYIRRPSALTHKNSNNLSFDREFINKLSEHSLSERILHMRLKLKKKHENEFLLKLGRFDETKAYLSHNNPYFSGEATFEESKNTEEGMKNSASCDIQGSQYPMTQDLENGGNISLEYEVTHRGIFHFIPRHSDEVEIDRGDPLYVQHQSSDLWGEGINLRTGEFGIFPLAYIILDEEKCITSDEDLKTDRFLMNYLGSVEVDYHKGNHVICQAMSKICLLRKMCSTCPIPICIIEIGSQGIRILCKNSRYLRYNIPHRYYFPFYNISFCGYNPKDPRYFGFITKHPIEHKYACHVFLASAPTQLVVESIGVRFKGYYANVLECIKFNTVIEDIDEE